MPVAESVLQQQVHAFYSNHHDWLYAWLRHKLGCAHNAADVAHDTFVRVIASRDALLGIQEPRAYLTSTAKWLLLDRARRRLIEESYLADLTLLSESTRGYPSPDETMAALQALEQIVEALADLSPKAREAFVLHYLEEKTHAFIANHLCVSTKMVQKYLIQALVLCKAKCPAMNR